MSGDVHVQFCERPGVRFPRATHLVILIDGYRRWRWLETTVYKRLLEELATLDVELNRDKTRRVDLAKGESFTFLGSRLQNSRGIGVGAVLSSLGEHDLPWIVDWISCRDNRRHAGR